MRFRRRRLLAGLGSVAATAGCVTPLAEDDREGSEPDDGTEESEPSDDPGMSETGDGEEQTEDATDRPAIAEQGIPGDICDREPDTTDIHPIVEPAFADSWRDHEIESLYDLRDRERDEEGSDAEVLPDRAGVIGIERGDRARAYPVIVLQWHEIVNDQFGGRLLVTFCPLCSSGLTAVREVDGEPTEFGVTGHLWRPPTLEGEASIQGNRTFGSGVERPDGDEARVRKNLVMYDRETGSFWSQLLAEAICGPRTGDRLEIVPAETTTWGDWRASHPDSTVLLPPPHSTVGTEPF